MYFSISVSCVLLMGVFVLCGSSRFIRPAAEDEESQETLSPKHPSINGSATNGVMEEGSPSKHAVFIPHSLTSSRHV